MKKLITIIIIITVIFSTMNAFSYGSDTDKYDSSVPNTGGDVSDEMTQDDFTAIAQEGTAQIEGETSNIKPTDSSAVATAGTLTKVLTFIPWTVSNLMTMLVTTGNTRENYSTTPDGPFSIENVVFDRIEVLNANYFVQNASTVNYEIKQAIKNWYSGTQIIAIAASVVTLIYMGIRMGLSTVASEKATYKRMMLDWLIGFAIIFIIHIIIIFASNLSTSLTFIFSKNVEEATLETNIMDYNVAGMQSGKGWSPVSQAIIYAVLVFYQLRFLIMYMKRFFTIGFLIVISPLMTITYAIDKAGDKKSQIFNTWGKELGVNLFIQPLHALLYLVFMYSAGQIAAVAPLFAIAFIMALSRGEKIVKGIFNLRGLSTINSMGATLKPRSS